MATPEQQNNCIRMLEMAVASGGTMMASESNFNSMRDILGISWRDTATAPASHEKKESAIPSDLLAYLLQAQLAAYN